MLTAITIVLKSLMFWKYHIISFHTSNDIEFVGVGEAHEITDFENLMLQAHERHLEKEIEEKEKKKTP